METPAENPARCLPSDAYRCDPEAGAEGEGWGSDSNAQPCNTPLSTVNKKKKRRKK